MTRRRAAAFVLLSAAGVAVNAAVAWSCAVWSPLEYDMEYSMRMIEQGVAYVPDRSWLDAIGYGDASKDVFSSDRIDGFGVRMVEVTATIDPALFNDEYGSVSCLLVDPFAVRTSAGWPLHGFEGEQLHPSLHLDGSWRGWWPRGGVEIPGTRAGSGHVTAALLPLRPIPVGFIVNSLLYAGVLAAVIGGVRLVRRRSRIDHGLCPRCRYPIGVAPVCSECGTSLAASAP